MEKDREQSTFEPVFTLTAGPSGATAATLSAMSQPLLYDYDPIFRSRYFDTVVMLQEAFGTVEVPVVLHGEAILGLEAVAASMISADDVVLNVISGHYAKGFSGWARRHAKEVLELEFPFDSAVDADRLRTALAERPDVTIVAAVHCDTPSGTRNDLGAVGAVVAEHGAFLIVDAVASFAGEHTDFAAWGADVVVVGAQKCLGGPPGLSLLHVSDRAWEHMASNPAAPRASVLSILDWREAHLPDRRFPFTPSIVEINALHATLVQYLDEGAAAVQARHAQAAAATRAGMVALGLALWPISADICSNTVTALKVPPGIDDALLIRLARSQSGVMLSGGQGSLVGKVFRVGHMGPSAFAMAPVLAVTALGRALRSLGRPADVGGAVEAVLASLDGTSN